MSAKRDIRYFSCFIVMVSALLLLLPVGSLASEDQKPAAPALSGEITGVEAAHGNLLTNVSAVDFLKLGYRFGDQVQFTMGGKSYTLPFVRSFSDVPKDKPLICAVRMKIVIAVNMGSAESYFGIKPPSPVAFNKK
jgi:S-adenosyl-L-methionine hydrolase (adenosine-forming)